MYGFIKTETGWVVYWGPRPVLNLTPEANKGAKGRDAGSNDEPRILPFVPRKKRERDLIPAA